MVRLRGAVFFPPFVLIGLALVYSAIDSKGLAAHLTRMNEFSLTALAPLFSTVPLVALGVCIAICFLPFGKTRIGGRGAVPMLRPISWMTVTLCTSTAMGILFWAIAEPISHYASPPVALGVQPESEAAMRFALSTLYLHWTLIPNALYTLPALLFAFAFYNMKLPFSLSSPLVPLFGRRFAGSMSDTVDSVTLFALVAGMAASLATGILTLSGGIEHQWGWRSGPATWILVGTCLVAAFITAAASGLQKGVKALSNFNTVLFFALAFYVLVCGPTRATLLLSAESLGEHFRTGIGRSLFLGFSETDLWPKQWTLFYWSVWLAWAPVTAVFLGRIGVGYSVRSFILVNLGVPALFSFLWMSIFGGTALSMEHFQAAHLGEVLKSRGPEALVYAMLERFPASSVVIPVFLLTGFVAYVTSANSNTLAMASMSSKGMAMDASEPPLPIKVLWGCLVGVVALVLLCVSGVDGIKMISYLGGVPALFYELLALIALLRVASNPGKYDRC
jgi:glycine betaine transporter